MRRLARGARLGDTAGMRHAWIWLGVVACGAPGDDVPGPDAGPPPVGDGIASAYPGDVGLGDDPRVIFFDDFEGYASAADFESRWSAVFGRRDLSTDPDHVWAGAQALEFTQPQGTDEVSSALAIELTDEVDTLYLRYYSRFADNFDIVGSSHNGADISAHYYQNGNATSGVPADGTNKFLVAFESWRGEAAEPNPGRMNTYVYHPAQRSNYGDHFFPDGTVLPNSSEPGEWGADFVPRADVVPALDRWYHHELMVHANTPGQRDGRITCWMDGQVIADFTGLRLRDVAELTISRFGLSLHAGGNPSGETRKWYDNVVAATAYVGPMVPR